MLEQRVDLVKPEVRLGGVPLLLGRRQAREIEDAEGRQFVVVREARLQAVHDGLDVFYGALANPSLVLLVARQARDLVVREARRLRRRRSPGSGTGP